MSAISVLLECHHEVLFYPTHKPKKNDFVWCIKCSKYSFINTQIKDHSWRCLECQASRHYKANKNSAMTGGQKHHKLSGHTVEVLDSHVCYYVFTEQTEMFPQLA